MNNETVVSSENIVDRVHHEKFLEFIPVIVCLSILSVVGIVGNGFAIGFYGFHSRRTPTVFMITALAIVDLSVCTILIHAIIEIAVNVHYTSRATCKIFHFAIHWAITASALILGLISIDRYRRICKSLKKQIDVPLAKKLVIGIVLIAFVLSIRDFVNFDIIQFDLNSGTNGTRAIGHYCTTTDNPRLKVSVAVFVYIDALLIVLTMGTLVFTYGRIVWSICRHGGPSSSKPGQTGEQVTRKPLKSAFSEAATTSTDCSTDTTKETESRKTKIIAKSKSSMKKSERSITLLMLIISVGFLVCFVPYFIIKLGLRSVKRASDLELSAGIQFAIRLVYVNSFLNPLVFCMFNPQFRRYIRDIVSKCRSDPELEADSSSQVQLKPGQSQTTSE